MGDPRKRTQIDEDWHRDILGFPEDVAVRTAKALGHQVCVVRDVVPRPTVDLWHWFPTPGLKPVCFHVRDGKVERSYWW